MTPAEIILMQADALAGTQGDWESDTNRNVVYPGGYICETYQHSADARRVARVPRMEATVIALTETNAAQAAEIERMQKALAIFAHYGENITIGDDGLGGVTYEIYSGLETPKPATFEDGTADNNVCLSGPISPDACLFGIYANHQKLKGALLTPVLQARHFIEASAALKGTPK